MDGRAIDGMALLLFGSDRARLDPVITYGLWIVVRVCLLHSNIRVQFLSDYNPILQRPRKLVVANIIGGGGGHVRARSRDEAAPAHPFIYLVRLEMACNIFALLFISIGRVRLLADAAPVHTLKSAVSPQGFPWAIDLHSSSRDGCYADLSHPTVHSNFNSVPLLALVLGAVERRRAGDASIARRYL